MLLYLTKRFLLALPSLWLIATCVFLLSRLLPGTFGYDQILKESGGFYATGQADAREAAYASFLQKTGQHLPLFYFSIRSAAEPDTLHHLMPGPERNFLEKLSWTYGNGPATEAYYKSIKELEQETSSMEHPEQRVVLDNLYKNTAQDTIIATINALHDNFRSKSQLQQAAAHLVQQRQPYNIFIPVFYWHGTQNQYHQWLMKLLQGNLGNSYRDNRPVVHILSEAIQTTLLLLLTSMTITALLALELGVFLLKQAGRRWKKIILPFLFLTDRIPVFLLALLFLVLFASPDYFQIFPVYGLGYYNNTNTGWLQHFLFMSQFMVLPLICLVLVSLPYLTTQFYRAFADVSQTEYVKTAKAKGLGEGAIIRRHILRNALLPVITLLSDFLPALVGGAVVIETIFAIPGIGSLLVQAVQARDYPVIVGIVTVVALAKILSHFLADLLYGLADPRIRLVSP